MPNVIEMTVEEAKKELKELGLDVNVEQQTEEIEGEDISQKIVMEQLPKKGIQVNAGTKVTIYIQ